jgi:hypothetical protein
MSVLRRWWPIPVIFGGTILVQTAALLGRDAKGHAAGHLGSAKFVFLATALIITILWAAPRTRRQPAVLLAAAAWLAAVGAFSVGNLQVVDAIDGADWTADEADRLGADAPGFESGHDLAELAAPLALLAAILLTVVLWRRAHVGTRASIAAIGMSVLIPFFLIPGAGVVALAAATCWRRHARDTTTERVRRAERHH